MSHFPGMLLRYFLRDFDMVPVVPIATGTIFVFTFHMLSISIEARGGVVVKALIYKPTGREIDSRWCHWNFSVT
jgi:hypothetical protein